MSNIATLTHTKTTFSADVRTLKSAADLGKAQEVAKNDGLDQVFVKASDKVYVLQGLGLGIDALQKSGKDGVLPKVQLQVGEEILTGEVVAVDNECNTAGEGMGKVAPVAVATGLTGLVPLAAAAGIELVAGSLPVVGGLGGAALGLSTVSFNSNDLRAIVGAPVAGAMLGATAGQLGGDLLRSTLGSAQLQKLGLISAAAGLAAAGLIVAGGAVYGANRSVKNEALNALTN